MAVHEDDLLRPQIFDARSGSPGRKSELSFSENPLIRRRSGQSGAGSPTRSEDNRSITWQDGGPTDNRPGSAVRRGTSRKTGPPTPTLSPRSNARTVPAWVRSAEEIDHPSLLPPLLPAEPRNVRVAQHLFAPHEKQGETLNYGSRDIERESRWKTFARSTAHPPPPFLQEKLVTPEWLNEHLGDYSEPWQGDMNDGDLESGTQSARRRKMWWQRLEYRILRSPIVPLIIRLTVFVFSMIALALGGSIKYLAKKYNHPMGPSAEMAIIVDAVALVYLVYITYDEYTGKPLGLRPAAAKMRLIFLDLFFIVFDSANLSLAFESLSDVRSACTFGEADQELAGTNDDICVRQKALASVLLIALVAWLMTFAISVLRLVERVKAK
ncbi:hypothetical protein AJ80_04758 [Polytolypa hystricis UAMH7299]|uniref:Regulator of phospholipase D SRF1 n=1 Tax=Polytolypa hystricis (strain UAMH7299) TaxID=1447883 RepID=A0A2B7Y8P9_POLH7|nr:hypothetical protein AJ80_04758 [Polytolypa hystricis UAMH7299]